MSSDPQIEIGQQDWRIIPPELKDGLSMQRLSKRRLRNWALVLQARQIPCKTEQHRDSWQLLVPVEHFKNACEELQHYEEENRNWPPPLPAEAPEQENTAATIWVLIGLGVFHIISQQRFNPFGHTPVDWYSLGNADAAKILAGDWWRLLTALSLHSGGIHLASNIIVGGLFVNRLCRDLGTGLGWGLVLLSGALGNLANALVQSPAHRSIGASTAVFGAVGLLAAINMLRYRKNLRRRWPLPVAAALGLLALLGAGGENTDIGAHLFGFCFGIGLGLFSEATHLRDLLTPARSRILSLLLLGSLPLCWWLALRG